MLAPQNLTTREKKCNEFHQPRSWGLDLDHRYRLSPFARPERLCRYNLWINLTNIFFRNQFTFQIRLIRFENLIFWKFPAVQTWLRISNVGGWKVNEKGRSFRLLFGLPRTLQNEMMENQTGTHNLFLFICLTRFEHGDFLVENRHQYIVSVIYDHDRMSKDMS